MCLGAHQLHRLLARLRRILDSAAEGASDFVNTIWCDHVVVLWKLNRDTSLCIRHSPIEWVLNLFLGHLTSELRHYFILQLHAFAFI